MKENSICNTLYHIFNCELPLDEIYSFILFLKGCGAYEKYVNNMSIDKIKACINIRNKKNSYHRLISISFIWSYTKEGQYYWSVIDRLHKIIISYKRRKNNINFIEKAKEKLYFHEMFNEIYHLITSYDIEDKNLIHFINCLHDYIMKNE